jgi:acyl-CoA synthetase (AMP-forming)/AMP-acid ligase II
LEELLRAGRTSEQLAGVGSCVDDASDVDEVAVVAACSCKWGETPVAVVVAKPGSELTRQALIDWANARVGKQQRIRDVIWRAALPRNPNGKVLKRELRQELAGLIY